MRKKIFFLLLVFLPLIAISQVQPGGDFYWNSGFDTISTKLYLIDTLTGVGDLNYEVYNYTGSSDYLNRKSTGFLVRYGDTIAIRCISENNDMADTLFAKIESHTLNTDSTESLPNRITNIGHWPSTAEDLNNFYNALPKDGPGILHVGPDRDYETINDAYAVMGHDDSMYVYTSSQEVETVLTYWWIQTRGFYKAVGNVDIVPENGNRTIFFNGTGSKILDGFHISGSNSTGTILDAGVNSTDNVVQNCYFSDFPINPTTDPITINSDAELEIINNVFVGNLTNNFIRSNGNTNTLDECYIGGGFVDDLNSGSSDTTFNLEYCDIRLDTGDILSGTLDLGTYKLNYNNIEIINANTSVINRNQGGSGVNIICKGNTITSDLESVNPFLFASGVFDSIVLDNNTITYTDSSHENIIMLFSNINCPVTISNCFIDTRNPVDLEHIQFTSTGTQSGQINILNNEFHTRAKEAHTIRIGTEVSTAGDNTLDGGNIIGNKILGPLYWNDTLTNVTVHIAFVGFNRDWTIENNYVDGGGINYLFKSSGDSNTIGGFFYNISINPYLYSFYSKGHRKVKFYNNASLNSLNSVVNHFYLSENIGGDGANECDLRNNAAYDTVNNANNIGIRINAGVEGVISDDNIYYMAGGNYGAEATTLRTLSAWRVFTGLDLNSFDTDPLFRSFTEPWPTAGSDALGNGTDLGVAYNQGLDTNSVHPDSLISKTQLENWTMGVYPLPKTYNFDTIYYEADTTTGLWSIKLNDPIYNYKIENDTILLNIDNFKTWSLKINTFIKQVVPLENDTINFNQDNFGLWRQKFNNAVDSVNIE